MLILGLTGSIGSGKSFVVSCFREMGAEVISADDLAREVIQPHTSGYHELINEFGTDILEPDGSVNRSALASIVFKSSEKLQKLEQIIHPRVRAREEELIAQYANSSPHVELTVLEIPLLFETGAEDLCDAVAVVTLDDDTRFKRLMEARGMTREKIEQRLSAQLSQNEKINRADYLIDNNGSKENTRDQVEKLYTRLVSTQD